MRVGGNPSTPPEILDKVSKDSDDWVRAEVGRNPSTPLKILNMLSKSRDRAIRIAVGENPKMTQWNLKELRKAPSEEM